MIRLLFVTFPYKRRLKARKGVYYKRKLRRLLRLYVAGRVSLDDIQASITGWVNHVRYGNTVGLRKAVLDNLDIP